VDGDALAPDADVVPFFGPADGSGGGGYNADFFFGPARLVLQVLARPLDALEPALRAGVRFDAPPLLRALAVRAARDLVGAHGGAAAYLQRSEVPVTRREPPAGEEQP
jgi:hypothetical protein